MLCRQLKILEYNGFFVDFTVISNFEGNGYNFLQEQSPTCSSFALNVETEYYYLRGPVIRTSPNFPLN
jgi:hypothetical protein